MVPKLVGKGNANVLIRIDESGSLYRCCVKYPDSVSQCNQYTQENYDFIETIIRPLFLQGLVCPMELVEISVGVVLDIYGKYMNQSKLSDSDKILCFRLPNLKASNIFTNILQEDHLTKIYVNKHYSRILLEIKPKWIDYSTSYCRNCTDNSRKGRNIKYCYSNLLKDSTELNKIIVPSTKEVVPSQFITIITEYLKDKGNILQKICTVQSAIQKRMDNNPSNEINDLQLLMTLRDVTCFIEWDDTMGTIDDIQAYIVDVDLKPTDKVDYWKRTTKLLDVYSNKTFH